MFHTVTKADNDNAYFKLFLVKDRLDRNIR